MNENNKKEAPASQQGQGGASVWAGKIRPFLKKNAKWLIPAACVLAARVLFWALKRSPEQQVTADPDVEPDVQPVCFRFTVDRPALWSAEQPELYTAEICLEHGGAVAERTELPVGLRKFERQGSQMLLNGKRIVFCGVNRHEWSCRTGRTVEPGRDGVGCAEPESPQRQRCAHQPLPQRPLFFASV